MRSRTPFLAGGFLLGATAGWLLAQRRLVVHRRQLFSPHPRRRMAALGFLAGQSGIETVRLLRDYLSWERQPRLRRRAAAILRRLEARLATLDMAAAPAVDADVPDAAPS